MDQPGLLRGRATREGRCTIKDKCMLIKIFLTLFICIQSGYGLCATIPAETCSDSDIRTAIASASAGDTVTIPAGSCTWSAPPDCAAEECRNIRLTIPINLVGSGIDSTIITDNNTSSSNTYSTPISIEYASNSDTLMRVSGFTVVNPQNHGTGGFIFVTPSGSGIHQIRVSYIKFSGTGVASSRNISWSNSARGVVDNCQFYTGGNLILSADTDWDSTFEFGNPDRVFWEDNIFAYDGSGQSYDAIDCQNGGRLVFRNNSFTGSGTYNNKFTDCHGCDSVTRSCMQQEVYNNIFSNTGSNYGPLIGLRGGTALIYNNTLTNIHSGGIGFSNNRSSSLWSGLVCTAVDTDFCDGNDAGDGNTSPIETNHGWPCRDQIGRSGGTSEGYQTLKPARVWNNTLNGSGVNATVHDYDNTGGTYYTSTHIQADRDFYTCTDSSCAKPGYIPYTYPHPLRGERSGNMTGGQSLSGGSLK